MGISFIHMRILAHLHVKTNFHMKEVGLKTCLSRTSQTSQQLQTDRQQTMLPESWDYVEKTSFFLCMHLHTAFNRVVANQ